MKIMLGLLLNQSKELPTPHPKLTLEENNFSSFQKLSKFLKSSYALITPSIFSSDNSLLSCYTYGDDIYDLIRYTKKVADRLLLDEPINHDALLEQRRISLVKSMFIGRDGSFPDVHTMLTELRRHSLRLCEGLELRTRNVELGVHTFQNLTTAVMVFKDLDAFYMEVFRDYRDNYTPQRDLTNGRG